MRIEAWPVPRDNPDHPELLAIVGLLNAANAAALGDPDAMRRTPQEIALLWRSAYEQHDILVARDRGEIVGFLDVEHYADDSAFWLHGVVAPDHRHRGIASALYDEASEIVDGADVQVYATEPRPAAASATSGLPPIPAATGWGGTDADSPVAAFLQPRGFRLEQIERLSMLRLPADLSTLPEREAAASALGYRLHGWSDRTPPEFRELVAIAQHRMNTDAPNAELAPSADVWDAQRVADEDDRIAASGRTLVSTIAVHAPTGEIAGFTSIDLRGDRPASQRETIVLDGHRGHQLGMLIKLANLARITDVDPHVASVFSGNAEENRYMLDVNEAIGFAPIGQETLWKRVR